MPSSELHAMLLAGSHPRVGAWRAGWGVRFGSPPDLAVGMAVLRLPRAK